MTDDKSLKQHNSNKQTIGQNQLNPGVVQDQSTKSTSADNTNVNLPNVQPNVNVDKSAQTNDSNTGSEGRADNADKTGKTAGDKKESGLSADALMGSMVNGVTNGVTNVINAVMGQPAKSTTDVDALFKIFENNKSSILSEELKKKLKTAFQEAQENYGALIKKVNSKQLMFLVEAFKGEEVKKHVSGTLIQGYEQSVQKAIEVAGRYFSDEHSAHYAKSKSKHNGDTKDQDRKLNVLSVFLNGNVSQSTKISDLLLQESDIDKLRVYRYGMKEVVASKYKVDNINARNYKFKKGANYDMVITWNAEIGQDTIEKISMVVSVSDKGITKVRSCWVGNRKIEDIRSKMDAILKVVEQNEELYINGSPFYDEFEKISIGMSSEQLMHSTALNNTAEGVKSTDSTQQNTDVKSTDSTQQNSVIQPANGTPKNIQDNNVQTPDASKSGPWTQRINDDKAKERDVGAVLK